MHSCICKIVDIPNIKQNTYYYCAPACIQMIIQNNKSQDEIYKELQNYCTDLDRWYIEPDAVYMYINKYSCYCRTSTQKTSSIEATHLILSSIMLHERAAPMLVSGGKHWVVYCGYQFGQDGEITGIYIKDPWPISASLVFYPFHEYFFNDYFREIDIAGKWFGKIEAFYEEVNRLNLNIRLANKPIGGGSIMLYSKCFKEEIIYNDMKKYGFSNVKFLKGGGSYLNDIEIYDIYDKLKFVITVVDIENILWLVAIDTFTNSVIGVMKYEDNFFSSFNTTNIITSIKSFLHNNLIDDLKFCYNKKVSHSCFEPFIKISSDNLTYYFDLGLKPIQASFN